MRAVHIKILFTAILMCSANNVGFMLTILVITKIIFHVSLMVNPPVCASASKSLNIKQYF